MNLNAGYRVSDVLVAYAKQAKPVDYLYKGLQFGLRAAVGSRTLDELLENKGVIDEVVEAHIRRRIEGFGLGVESVGVKDIILPGDMKAILAKVVEAEESAQANVIRRRDETAAARSLLNTAKVMEDNPTARGLNELETLEKVTEKIDKISGVRRSRRSAEGSGEDPLNGRLETSSRLLFLFALPPHDGGRLSLYWLSKLGL